MIAVEYSKDKVAHSAATYTMFLLINYHYHFCLECINTKAKATFFTEILSIIRFPLINAFFLCVLQKAAVAVSFTFILRRKSSLSATC